MNSRPWWIAQVALAVLLAVTVVVFHIAVAVGAVDVDPDPGSWGLPWPQLTLGYFVSILAVSLVINGLILRGRPSRTVGPGERPLLVGEAATIAALVAVAVLVPGVPDVVILLLWIIALALALTTFVVELVNAREQTARPARRP